MGTADLVTVLAGLVAVLLSVSAEPDSDPDARFEARVRAQLGMGRIPSPSRFAVVLDGRPLTRAVMVAGRA
ncbi:hypothetical protein AB0J38_27785 [Streptomyces sp. NPDC050095]|uniref:hypothetical protein n=1 Tax=unclassified Streptomyces TaxID=2593676 RepID=UPI0034169CD5